MRKLIKHIIKYEINIILSCFILLVAFVLLIKDYLTVVLFGGNFDFSASLLYKLTIAVFFIPIIFSNKWQHWLFGHKINVPQVMAFIVMGSLLHIIISSYLISTIAYYLLDMPLTYIEVLQKHLSQNLMVVFTLYGLMFLLVRYYALYVHEFSQSLVVSTGKQQQEITLDAVDWIEMKQALIIIWSNQCSFRYLYKINRLIHQLPPHQFIRIGPNIIVNVNKIDRVIKRSDSNYDIHLHDKTILLMHRIYKKALQ